MSDLAGLVLSIVMLAVGGLFWGGVYLWRNADRKKGVLMGVVAIVMLGNVLILTL